MRIHLSSQPTVPALHAIENTSTNGWPLIIDKGKNTEADIIKSMNRPENHQPEARGANAQVTSLCESINIIPRDGKQQTPLFSDNLQSLYTKTLTSLFNGHSSFKNNNSTPDFTEPQNVTQHLLKQGFVKEDGSLDITKYSRDRMMQAAITVEFINARHQPLHTADTQHQYVPSILEQGRIKPDGSTDTVVPSKHRNIKFAITQGCLKESGSPDITLYNRQSKERRALLHGWMTADGQPDINAYARSLQRKYALSTGFVTPDGHPDMSAIVKNRNEKNAISRGFIRADGRADLTALSRFWKKRSALKKGFVKPDGSPDMTAFNRNTLEQTALRQGFIKKDNTPDTTAYTNFTKQRRAVHKRLAIQENID